jgi:hypothetical protein
MGWSLSYTVCPQNAHITLISQQYENLGCYKFMEITVNHSINYQECLYQGEQ